MKWSCPTKDYKSCPRSKRLCGQWSCPTRDNISCPIRKWWNGHVLQEIISVMSYNKAVMWFCPTRDIKCHVLEASGYVVIMYCRMVFWKLFSELSKLGVSILDFHLKLFLVTAAIAGSYCHHRGGRRGGAGRRLDDQDVAGGQEDGQVGEEPVEGRCQHHHCHQWQKG